MADNKKTEDENSLDEQSTVINPTTSSENKDDTTDSESLAEADVNTSQTEAESHPKKPHGWKRIFGFANLYFIIFILLLILVAGGIFISIKLANKSGNPESTKSQSLTDEQLADLKGNTTLVGDSDQILDIQGSAVFEQQVLMRKNLDVAGSIKVGGSLSLPAITVGGTSSFGQIHVNDTLSVNGITSLQRLTVANAASFNGVVSANQLNVSNLQLTGDLVISRHLATSGSAPTRSNGSALGSGGTVSINGTDTAGTVTINTGGGPPAGCFTTISFRQSYGSIPHVIISPSNSSAANLNYYTNRSTTNFSVCTTNSPAAATNYLFDYFVIN